MHAYIHIYTQVYIKTLIFSFIKCSLTRYLVDLIYYSREKKFVKLIFLLICANILIPKTYKKVLYITMKKVIVSVDTILVIVDGHVSVDSKLSEPVYCSG